MTRKASDQGLRILLDANLYIGALLVSDRQASPPARIVDWALNGNCEIVFPARLRAELFHTVQKPYLRARIPSRQLDRLFAAVALIDSNSVHDHSGSLPEIRDINDRYLLEEARLHHVDVLISGDKDLFALVGERPPFLILTPSEFAARYLDLPGAP